jgi:hypothetical protein
VWRHKGVCIYASRHHHAVCITRVLMLFCSMHERFYTAGFRVQKVTVDRCCGRNGLITACCRMTPPLMMTGTQRAHQMMVTVCIDEQQCFIAINKLYSPCVLHST